MARKRRPRISAQDLFRALYDAEQWNAELLRAQSRGDDMAEYNDELRRLIRRLRAFRLAWFGESEFDAACKRSTLVDVRLILHAPTQPVGEK